jgi:hypothetical protein
MSIKLMNEAWLCDLPPLEKLVLLSMADQASDSGHCWPSLKSISARCGRDDRSVRRWIARLVDRGHMSRIERPGTSNIWHCHPIPTIPEGGMTEMTGGQGCHTPHDRFDRGGMTDLPAKPPLNHQRTVKVVEDTREADLAKAMTRIKRAWNAMALPLMLPRCMVLSEKRSKALKARLKDYGEEQIITAINVIPTSPFLRGESGRWGGADFDFLMRPDSVLSILEGKYNDRSDKTGEQGDGLARAIKGRLDNRRDPVAA